LLFLTFSFIYFYLIFIKIYEYFYPDFLKILIILKGT